MCVAFPTTVSTDPSVAAEIVATTSVTGTECAYTDYLPLEPDPLAFPTTESPVTGSSTVVEATVPVLEATANVLLETPITVEPANCLTANVELRTDDLLPRHKRKKLACTVEAEYQKNSAPIWPRVC